MTIRKATPYTIPKSLRIKNLVSQYERELFIEPNGGLKCEEIVLFIFWIHSQYQYRFFSAVYPNLPEGDFFCYEKLD
jgi:hypothetical protein